MTVTGAAVSICFKAEISALIFSDFRSPPWLSVAIRWNESPLALVQVTPSEVLREDEAKRILPIELSHL